MRTGTGTAAASTAAVLLVVLAAACGEPAGDEPPEPATSPVPETIGEGSASLVGGDDCHNPDADYRISYPSAWSANDGSVTTPCTVFGPGPVILEQQTEIPIDIGIVIGTAPGELQDHVEATGGIEVDDRTETVVAGRDAAILRGRGTGDALIPAGTRLHRYVVELDDDRILLASTYDSGDVAFARKIEVLDAMMDTLRFGAAAG